MTRQMAATMTKPLELTGDLIRDLRSRAGLTQAALADRLGVTAPTVANWENDRSNPQSADLAIELVKVLGPEPEPSDTPRLLPATVWTIRNGWAATKPAGGPPILYRTTSLKFAEIPQK